MAVLAYVAAGLAASAPPAAASPAQDEPSPTEDAPEIAVPPEWDQWDSDGDGVLAFSEWEQLSGDQQQAVEQWVDDLGQIYSDDDLRAWAPSRFEAVASVLAGIPGHDVGFSDVPDVAVGAGTNAASGVAESVAAPAVEAVANSVGEAASDLSGYLSTELARTGRPQLEADWYQEHYQRMLGWAGLLIVPLALAAIGGAVARGDPSKVGQTLLQIPVVYLMGTLAVSLVSAASGLSGAMARSFVPSIEESSAAIGERVGQVLTVRPQMGAGLVLLIGLATAIAALATLVWLLLTEAALYAVVLFFPLAFAGRVWEPVAAWARRLLSLALALIGARVVIFALWALTVDGLAEVSEGDVPLRSALAVAALLVMTAAAPLAVLRLVPMAEGSEAAGSPGAVGRQGLNLAYQGASLGRSMRGGMSGGGGRGGRLPVTGKIVGAAARTPGGAANLGFGSGGSQQASPGGADSGSGSTSKGSSGTPARSTPGGSDQKSERSSSSSATSGATTERGGGPGTAGKGGTDRGSSRTSPQRSGDDGSRGRRSPPGRTSSSPPTNPRRGRRGRGE